MTEERKNNLRWLWEEETNDPDTQEWRDELTHEEQALIDVWDEGYAEGMLRMARGILEQETQDVGQGTARLEALLDHAQKNIPTTERTTVIERSGPELER